MSINTILCHFHSWWSSTFINILLHLKTICRLDFVCLQKCVSVQSDSWETVANFKLHERIIGYRQIIGKPLLKIFAIFTDQIYYFKCNIWVHFYIFDINGVGSLKERSLTWVYQREMLTYTKRASLGMWSWNKIKSCSTNRWKIHTSAKTQLCILGHQWNTRWGWRVRHACWR